MKIDIKMFYLALIASIMSLAASFFTPFALIACLVVASFLGMVFVLMRKKQIGFSFGFYLASLIFVALPSYYYYNISKDSDYIMPGIINFVINSKDIESALIVIALGILPFIFANSLVFKRTVVIEFQPNGYAKLIYIPSTLACISVAGYGYYTSNGDILLSGISGLALAFSSLSASSIVRKNPNLINLLLFIPSIILAFLTTNRGTLITIVAIIFFSYFRGKFSTRKFIPMVVVGYFLVNFVASLLGDYRRDALVATSYQDSFIQSPQFLSKESIMVPTLGLVMYALETKQLEFQNGKDLFITPLYVVPRIIWPQKPMPLDYRLNDQLNLNAGDTFGTPITIFGGMFLNLGWLLYPIAMLFMGIAASYYMNVRDQLLNSLAFIFALDLVRVGDISREVTSFTLFLIAYVLLNKRRRIWNSQL